MQQKIIVIIAVIALVALVVGLVFFNKNDDDKQKKDVAAVLQEGNAWVFRGMSGSVDYSVEISVMSEGEEAETGFYVVETSFAPPESGMDNLTMKLNKKTLDPIQVRGSGTYAGFPFRMIADYSYEYSNWPNRVKVGKTWNVTVTESVVYSSMGQSEKDRSVDIYTFKVEAIEKIEVPAGTFTCYKIDAYDESESLVSTVWYSPKAKWNVKEIDYREDDTRELVSYEVSD